jgi:hypothetical protein
MVLAIALLAGGLGLLQLGLVEGRATSAAPILFDSPDLQTLIASTFIGVSAIVLIYDLQLILFTLKMLADLTQGPALLVGYVTTRETQNWRRNFRRQNYRLYLVSRQAFPLWLHGPALPEGAEFRHRKTWLSSLPAVVPSVFQVPNWIYETVREGDLVRLYYARWQRTVLDVEVIESVQPPSAPYSSSPAIEAETAEWRVIEPEE